MVGDGRSWRQRFTSYASFGVDRSGASANHNSNEGSVHLPDRGKSRPAESQTLRAFGYFSCRNHKSSPAVAATNGEQLAIAKQIDIWSTMRVYNDSLESSKKPAIDRPLNTMQSVCLPLPLSPVPSVRRVSDPGFSPGLPCLLPSVGAWAPSTLPLSQVAHPNVAVAIRSPPYPFYLIVPFRNLVFDDTYCSSALLDVPDMAQIARDGIDLR